MCVRVPVRVPVPVSVYGITIFDTRRGYRCMGHLRIMPIVLLHAHSNNSSITVATLDIVAKEMRLFWPSAKV